MRKIRISDATMRQTSEDFRLSFKEKIELSKLLDRLGVDVIELERIESPRIDALLVKAISAAVTESTVAVPVALTEESVERTFAALKEAKHPRLQISVPTSAVQIEYIFHMKPDALVAAVEKTVAACRALCRDVEFVAEDATRSEGEFLTRILSSAIAAGANTVTLCDTAGTMLPAELAAFVSAQYAALPALKDVTLGIACANTIAMADACAIAAVAEGASAIRAAAYPLDCASLRNVARILTVKADTFGVSTGIRVTELDRTIDRFTRTCHPAKGQALPALGMQDGDGVFLTVHDDIAAVAAAVRGLGYDLSEEDTVRVYDSFRQIAEKKEQVGLKELDAIVASSAMQVPSTYKLDTYLITSGNTVSATAHIKLTKNGVPVEGVYIGDGSIDAAFQAIEKITGCHYELDDFQLQAVTEGREAMGETIVKLRSGGKVYSGRGISTDIVGAGIEAYLSALNKIVYEEEVQ